MKRTIRVRGSSRAVSVMPGFGSEPGSLLTDDIQDVARLQTEVAGRTENEIRRALDHRQ
jgi:hypothetical protein